MVDVADGGREVGAVEVWGVDLDPQTRCRHYRSAVDIIAIRMFCCDVYYACAECHEALADHPIVVWPADRRHCTAVRCGACGHQLSIAAYLAANDRCPACGAGFNPGCRLHYPLYFAGRARP